MIFRPNMRRGSAVSFVRILRVVQERAYIFLGISRFHFEVLPHRWSSRSCLARYTRRSSIRIGSSPRFEATLGQVPDWVESQVRGHFGRVQSLARW